MQKMQCCDLQWLKMTKRIGIPPEQLQAFENANYCSYDLICQLCNILEIVVPSDCLKKST